MYCKASDLSLDSYEWRVHCPPIAIMYVIGSLLYVYSISPECKNMYKNYTKQIILAR